MQTLGKLEQAVRDALFLAASRTYGEQYVEPFLRAKYELKEPTSGDHDGVDRHGTRYEIKACKVLRSSENRKGTKSLLDRILYEAENLPTNRLVAFDAALSAQYDANVQNVKRDHFDVLIYVLFFADCAKVFMAKSTEITRPNFPSWSDKHGRYDQLGKSGQFPVTKSTIEWHLANTLKDTVTYGEMADVYKQLSDHA